MSPTVNTWLKAATGLAALLAPELACAQLAVTAIRPLAFGKFVAGTGGTVSVAPGGARGQTGGVLLLSSAASSADFLLRDDHPDNASNIVVVTLPPPGTVVLTSGANSMALTAFTSNPQAPSPLAGGSMTLSIGASLSVAPNQPRGNYSGSIPITVEYD